MDRVVPHGSRIVVDYTAKTLVDRDLAVFASEDGATFKRYRRDEDGVWLEPDSFNRRHQPLMFDGEAEIAIVGRVVAIPYLAGHDAEASR
jgi:SOS-response transcriptional repressor LexA